MRILVVGAGAVGGYFGGRLLEKGVDVTFLVREGRRKQLTETGLVIESIHGNARLVPKTIVAGEKAGSFDIVLLSTKAYSLEDAMDSVHPYIGKETVIMPMLNGILHYTKLAEEFGEDRVIGGLCFIETTLDQEGRIIQTSGRHDIVFGERSGLRTERILKIEEVFKGTKTGYRLSDDINQELWHKYLFIATMSGITTLMRAPIGPIWEQAEGRSTIDQLLNELVSIMKKVDAPLAADIVNLQKKQLEALEYSFKSSMQRDMEKLLAVEADHLHGYLLDVAKREEITAPVLTAIYSNLKIYEQHLS